MDSIKKSSKVVVQISDLHFTGNDDKSNTASENLDRIIENINMTMPDDCIIIATGDLVTHPTENRYKSLAEKLSKLKSPVYIIPGNHDDNKMMDASMKGNNIYHDKVITHDNWCILLLNSSYPGKNLGSGRLSDEGIEDLQRNLAKYAEKDIFLVIHHPPILFGADWFQQICLENRDLLNEIILQNNNIKLLAFGHAHTEFKEYRNNVAYIGAPSTWVQFDHDENDHASYTEASPGYNYYLLNEKSEFECATIYIE